MFDFGSLGCQFTCLDFVFRSQLDGATRQIRPSEKRLNVTPACLSSVYYKKTQLPSRSPSPQYFGFSPLEGFIGASLPPMQSYLDHDLSNRNIVLRASAG